MRSLSLVSIIAIFASLSVATKSPIAFALLKGLVTPGIVLSFGFRISAVPEIEVELDEQVNLPVRPPQLNRVIEKPIPPKVRDAALQLPRAIPADKQPDIQPFFIKIDSKGRVFANTGAAQELLEKDPEAKELKLLDQRIGLYGAAARAGDAVPMVQIFVEDEARHGRVQDVMNLLRKHQIDSVTFTDLVDAE